MRYVIQAAAIAVLTFGLPVNGLADETLRDEPRESAADIPGQFDRGIVEISRRETRWEEILNKSQLNLNLRNFWFNRDRPAGTDPLAWTQGNSIEYRVDKVGDIFDARMEYFGSFALDAPEDRSGSLLLEDGQDEIDVLGIANLRANLNNNIVSVFRQKYDLPFLNQQDNRMIPNTFEGYSVSMSKAENKIFQYIAGYIDKIKSRGEDEFRSMSEAVGGVDVGTKERGTVIGGARYYFIPEFSLAAIDLYTPDIYNNFYTESQYIEKFDEDISNSLSAQFATQSSVGQDLVLGESYTSGLWGLQEALSYKYATFRFAYNQTDTGANVRSPWGSYPGYNSSIVEDFNRAGEKSWAFGFSYVFKRIGLEELSLSTTYIHGLDAIDEVTKESLNDRQEIDVTIDYRFADGLLKGLWLRARSGTVKEDNLGTTNDFRFIVNYQLQIFSPNDQA